MIPSRLTTTAGKRQQYAANIMKNKLKCSGILYRYMSSTPESNNISSEASFTAAAAAAAAAATLLTLTVITSPSVDTSLKSNSVQQPCQCDTLSKGSVTFGQNSRNKAAKNQPRNVMVHRLRSLRGRSLNEKYNVDWKTVLGEGAYGSVHPARLAATGEKVSNNNNNNNISMFTGRTFFLAIILYTMCVSGI